MKCLLTCCVWGALALPALAQETTAPSTATVEQLIEQLGDPSYEVRQQAEANLQKKGKEALDAISKAAENSTDPEVRWRARRLADRIERGDAPARKVGDLLRPREQKNLPRGWRDRDLDDMFGSLFDRLEDDFGIDVPSRSFFHGPFFGDLDAQMRELQRRMQAMGKLDPNAPEHSRALQMNIGPDGAEIVIEEKNEKGEVEKKTYSAPSLEAFREKYPEVAREYLDSEDGGLSFRLDPDRFFGQLTPLPLPRDASADSGPVLGVYAQPAGRDLRSFLGLEEGRGLLVQTVVNDSLAERLGITAHDVILEIDGHPIGSAADVRAALRKAGETVVVTVNRRGEELRLEGAAEAPGAADH